MTTDKTPMIQNSDRLYQIAKDIIGFDTVSQKSNLEMAHYIANILKSKGAHIEWLSKEIDGVEKVQILAWVGPSEPGGLALSGHMDVVPYLDQNGWDYDGLDLQITDDKLIGRGTSDMKLFLVQALYVLEQIDIETLQKPLFFLITCDEEIEYMGSEWMLPVLKDLYKKHPWLPKQCLIGEPTNFDIITKHKGCGRIQIRLFGTAGHSSLPHKGLSAIHMAEYAFSAIRAFNQTALKERSDDDFTDYPADSINIGVINAGLETNIIADQCDLVGSVRLLPSQTMDAICHDIGYRIRDLVQKADDLSDWQKNRFRVEVTPSSFLPGIASSHNIPLVQTLQHFLTMHPSPNPDWQKSPQSVSFATDAGHLQQAGLEAVICGSGLIEQAHQPNEMHPKEHFEHGTKMLLYTIQNICG